MKQIIERNIRLNVCYNLIETKYVSLIESYGCACDNCGKLIANIATIKSEMDGNIYNIGFDCLDTILLNNQILRGEDLENYKAGKKCMAKVMKIKTEIMDFLNRNSFISKVELITETFLPGWLTLHYYNSAGVLRWNDGIRIKEMHFPTLLATLRQNKAIEFIYTAK